MKDFLKHIFNILKRFGEESEIETIELSPNMQNTLETVEKLGLKCNGIINNITEKGKIKLKDIKADVKPIISIKGRTVLNKEDNFELDK